MPPSSSAGTERLNAVDYYFGPTYDGSNTHNPSQNYLEDDNNPFQPIYRAPLSRDQSFNEGSGLSFRSRPYTLSRDDSFQMETYDIQSDTSFTDNHSLDTPSADTSIDYEPPIQGILFEVSPEASIPAAGRTRTVDDSPTTNKGKKPLNRGPYKSLYDESVAQFIDLERDAEMKRNLGKLYRNLSVSRIPKAIEDFHKTPPRARTSLDSSEFYGLIEQDCFEAALDETQYNAATTHRKTGRISTCISDGALQAQILGNQCTQESVIEDDSASHTQGEGLTRVHVESASCIKASASLDPDMLMDPPTQISGPSTRRDVMREKNVDVAIHSPRKSTTLPLTRTLRNGKTMVLVTPKRRARRLKVDQVEVVAADAEIAKTGTILRRRMKQGTKENIEGKCIAGTRNIRRAASKKHTKK